MTTFPTLDNDTFTRPICILCMSFLNNSDSFFPLRILLILGIDRSDREIESNKVLNTFLSNTVQRTSKIKITHESGISKAASQRKNAPLVSVTLADIMQSSPKRTTRRSQQAWKHKSLPPKFPVSLKRSPSPATSATHNHISTITDSEATSPRRRARTSPFFTNPSLIRRSLTPLERRSQTPLSASNRIPRPESAASPQPFPLLAPNPPTARILFGDAPPSLEETNNFFSQVENQIMTGTLQRVHTPPQIVFSSFCLTTDLVCHTQQY